MDQIDILSGLRPGAGLYEIRRERLDFVDGTELCRKTVLAPQHGFDISHAMRAALAARMARLIGHEALAKSYDVMLDAAGADPRLRDIAAVAPLATAADRVTTSLVRHADLVTSAPRESRRADIENLAAAGLSNPQIIALSELIAFVNYEARVIVALSVLEEVE